MLYVCVVAGKELVNCDDEASQVPLYQLVLWDRSTHEEHPITNHCFVITTQTTIVLSISDCNHVGTMKRWQRS
jgi:hypothetical protein